MIIKNKKTSIYVRKDKNINSESILFLHGFTGSHESWSKIRKETICTTLELDIPGHGQSIFNNLNETYSYDDWCTDLFLLLKQLKINKINICGYSMGGRLALIFALKYPSFVNKLILESTSLGIEDFDQRTSRKEDDKALADNILYSLEDFNIEWRKNNLFKYQEKRNEKEYIIQNNIRDNHNSNQLAKSLNSFSIGNVKYMGYDFKDLKMPIYIIIGNDDNEYIKISKNMIILNKKAQSFIVNNAHHNVHLENYEDFVYIINNYVYTN